MLRPEIPVPSAAVLGWPSLLTRYDACLMSRLRFSTTSGKRTATYWHTCYGLRESLQAADNAQQERRGYATASEIRLENAPRVQRARLDKHEDEGA